MKECIFCQIVRDHKKAHKIWEDDRTFVFLDMTPINPGHILIIPKIHVDYIFNLEVSLYLHLFEVARLMSNPLQEATKSLRIGLAVEGFGVSHAHLHLVPVNNGNELDPNRAKKASLYELEKMAQKIKERLIQSNKE